MQKVQEYISTNKDRFINELMDLLRIPSVSADSKYKADVLRTAEFVKASLEKAGADKVEICQTKGHPIVYGEKMIDKNDETLEILKVIYARDNKI